MKDPTGTGEHGITQLIKAMDWAEEVEKPFLLVASHPPRLYGHPNIHKVGCPVRPIVNTSGSPAYRVAKYQPSLLKPLLGQMESLVKNKTKHPQNH